MPAKTIQLPASASSAIAILEAHVASTGLPNGQAAAELIERGGGWTDAPLPVAEAGATPIEGLGDDELIDEFRRRLGLNGDIAALEAGLEQAQARARTAESALATLQGKFDQMKALFA